MILVDALWWILLLPVQLILFLWLAAAEVISALSGRFARPVSAPAVDAELCSVVVLNWNGRHLLQESLPALESALRFTGAPHELIVVDNGSEDDSCQWIRRHHPGVRLLELPENLGFGAGNNHGVQAALHPVVVLLNNDMIVEEDFLEPLLEGIRQPGVFAVSSQILFPIEKRREETGATAGRFRNGLFELFHEPIQRHHLSRRLMPVLWAGGGSSAYRRDLFLQLGGFSEIFAPCYFEDTDISYRAWRRGWQVLLAADSRVLHKHRSSSAKRFAREQLQRLMASHKLWYLWKNFQIRTLLGHFLLFPWHLRKEMGIASYAQALLKVPVIGWARATEPRRHLQDGAIFQQISDPIHYLNQYHPERVEQSRQPRLRILIVSAYLPHLGKHGGAGRVYQLMVRVARHHDVTLVTYVETPEEMEELPQVTPHCQRVETVLRRRFTPVSWFPYEPFEEFNCQNMRDCLQGVLQEEDFDLVHFEWTQMAMFRDLLPKIPTLITEIEVNYAAHMSQVHVETSWWRKIRKYYNTLQTLNRELQLCRQVDKVVCVTDIDRDFLKGYLPLETLEVVNTGVDTTYFHLGQARQIDPDALVYVGAFRHEPNVDAMRFFCREIFPLILEQRPRTRLYIVGSSPPKEIRDLARNPAISVTGFVPDIRDYYHLAQVVIVPLRTGVGIRGKILEGWAAGKAMVATTVACLGIEAVHGENIFIADKPEDFARWTLALLRNPEHCRRIGERGRRLVERAYEWDQLGRQMVRVYEQLVPEYRNRSTPALRQEVLS